MSEANYALWYLHLSTGVSEPRYALWYLHLCTGVSCFVYEAEVFVVSAQRVEACHL
jgi:hypothetical protein